MPSFAQNWLYSMALTARRSIHALRCAAQPNGHPEIEVVVRHIWKFAHRLQKRYPFNFANAQRDLPDERHRWVQERLVSYFLFGVIAELSGIDDKQLNNAWSLASRLSRTIGKGGENFSPHEFTVEEKKLAEEIGKYTFMRFIQQAEQLSLKMNFKFGPVNSAEHVIAWCFRYVRQLLGAAKWESVPRGSEHTR